MNYRLEKSLKILDELVIYCFKNGGKKMEINLSFEKNLSVFEIQAKVKRMTKENLEKLDAKLNAKRQREVEENYWMLGGDSELHGESEMFLVGIMIDEAKVDYDGETLSVVAKRKEP